MSRAVQRKESGAGWVQRKMALEGSCRAVDDWSRVIRGRHRGGILARGPSAADGRRAQCLGLAGRQCLAQCDQRRAAHRRVRLHSAEEGERSQDLHVNGLGVSSCFLVSYVIYHYHAGSKPFGGHGWIRGIYYPLLISHVVLAALIVPFALTTIYRAWRGEFARHRRIARWTLPVWLYVSVTGVIVYWMLYHLGP